MSLEWLVVLVDFSFEDMHKPTEIVDEIQELVVSFAGDRHGRECLSRTRHIELEPIRHYVLQVL